MSVAREEILARVRAARGAPGPIPRDYRRTGALADEERVALFCRRVGEYRATVRRVAADEVREAVADVCRSRGATTLAVPPGLPEDWRPGGMSLVVDDGLSARELDRVDGALSGCTVAIAATGTLVLSGSPHEGRRALSLVPDLHVCVVREPQVVELVPEALALLRAQGLERRPLTFVSGPSATSDIELSRVEGVHGPRDLVVLVSKESP